MILHIAVPDLQKTWSLSLLRTIRWLIYARVNESLPLLKGRFEWRIREGALGNGRSPSEALNNALFAKRGRR